MGNLVLYYCPNCGCLWWIGRDGEHKFYKWLRYATDEEVESSTERPCGCTD